MFYHFIFSLHNRRLHLRPTVPHSPLQQLETCKLTHRFLPGNQLDPVQHYSPQSLQPVNMMTCRRHSDLWTLSHKCAAKCTSTNLQLPAEMLRTLPGPLWKQSSHRWSYALVQQGRRRGQMNRTWIPHACLSSRLWCFIFFRQAGLETPWSGRVSGRRALLVSTTTSAQGKVTTQRKPVWRSEHFRHSLTLGTLLRLRKRYSLRTRKRYSGLIKVVSPTE